MDRPFRELHELWRILYNRAEAESKRAAAEKEKEEAEKRAQEEADIRRGAKPPQIRRQPPTDAKRVETDNALSLSPLQAEAMEDMMEDMMEGGMM